MRVLLFSAIVAAAISSPPAQAFEGASWRGQPRYSRQVTCVVENRFGERFIGRGQNQYAASTRAIQACHRVVRATCRVISCRR